MATEKFRYEYIISTVPAPQQCSQYRANWLSQLTQ